MKTVLIVLGIIILAAGGAGWGITYHSLGVTQSTLAATQISLHEVQIKLQDTTTSLSETRQKLDNTSNSLEETRQELQNTGKSLKETQQELAEQKTQTAKYILLYDGAAKELNASKQELSGSQTESQQLLKELNEAKQKLKLYQDTLGGQIYSGVMPPFLSGDSTITLVNNSAATNPTWKQLESFLKTDKTDKKLYKPGVYECGNFAQDLHNVAEAYGIRAAFVAILYEKGPGHALNAFVTLDRGLIYIDDTGERSPINLPNLDRIAQLKKGEPIHARLLFPDGWEYIGKSEIIKEIDIFW